MHHYHSSGRGQQRCRPCSWAASSRRGVPASRQGRWGKNFGGRRPPPDKNGAPVDQFAGQKQAVARARTSCSPQQTHETWHACDRQRRVGGPACRMLRRKAPLQKYGCPLYGVAWPPGEYAYMVGGGNLGIENKCDGWMDEYWIAGRGCWLGMAAGVGANAVVGGSGGVPPGLGAGCRAARQTLPPRLALRAEPPGWHGSMCLLPPPPRIHLASTHIPSPRLAAGWWWCGAAPRGCCRRRRPS